MRIFTRVILLGTIVLAVFRFRSAAAESPHIRMENGTGELIVNGQPFLILGGELGNSSSGTAEQADAIIPRLRSMHVNTILMPVTWEQIEPKEGSFDFDILDHWVERAREHQMHLVLLWFGSWKNAVSSYAPSWVKSDAKRFPRAESADGRPLEILSTLSLEIRRCDSRAFATLMHHVREKDSAQQTVLMVQVENEVGYLGEGRDRSPLASRLFGEPVPDGLIRALVARRLELPPELATHFNEHGRTWSEVFGDAANEVFMAWNYASFIEAVAHAGKSEYPLPMYVNAQLPAPGGETRRVSKRRATSLLSGGLARGCPKHRFLLTRYLLAQFRILGCALPGCPQSNLHPRSANRRCSVQCALRLWGGSRLRLQSVCD